MIPYILQTSICCSSRGSFCGEPAVLIRKRIAFSDVYVLDIDTTYMSLYRKLIIDRTTKLTNDIGISIQLRKIHLKLSNRCSRINCICNLILLQEHIDFFSIRSNQNSSLKRNRKGRLNSGYFLDTATLRKCVVHQDQFMDRECHSYHRSVLAHISGLAKNTLHIVLELLFYGFLFIFDLLRSLGVICLIDKVLTEESTKRFLNVRRTHRFCGFRKNIKRFSCQNILSCLSKCFCKGIKLVIAISIGADSLTSSIACNHYVFLLIKVIF